MENKNFTETKVSSEVIFEGRVVKLERDVVTPVSYTHLIWGFAPGKTD